MNGISGIPEPQASTRTRAFHIELNGKIYRLEFKALEGNRRWKITLEGKSVELDVKEIQPGVLSLVFQQRSYRCVFDKTPTETAVHLAGERFVFAVDDSRSLSARRRKSATAGGAQIVKAPMPGRVVRVLVSPGETVEAHQGVIVVEAMKMQNELKALRAGKVVEIRAEPGSTVTAGQSLVFIE
jgi:biotin carboxyl carrier protein